MGLSFSSIPVDENFHEDERVGYSIHGSEKGDIRLYGCVGRGSSPDLRLKLRDNYFCTYQFPYPRDVEIGRASLGYNTQET